MSETIDYGIDLGTTNSAIAHYEGDEIKVFKNRDQMDVTPSVVRIDKNGRIIVGKRAYQLLFEDFENVEARFKRWMGHSDPRYFKAANRSLTAEELSAEVLKSLLEDARPTNGSSINATVITVPAAFGQLQCEATARAAQLAGITQSPLLQEPIAAAIAYGMKPDARDQRWLVYDLGGGTFDIAIVSTKEGQLSVLEHRGNNMLGGMDFDRAIVTKLFWPKLQESFALPEAGRAISRYRRLVQILHREAEQAKIDLSFSDRVMVSIFNAGEDDENKTIEIEFEITRNELNSLVEEPISKTLTLAHQAIGEARINKEDISKIVLVGGPTYMPIVREMLTNDLGIALDYSIDPMTVVARGAAIYASTIPKQQPVISTSASASASASASNLNSSNTTPSTSTNSNDIKILLAHENVWSETECLVAGRIEALPTSINEDTKLEVRVEPTTKHWTSGWLPVVDRYFETEVRLLEGKTTKFEISMRNEKGEALNVTPSSFSIRHGLTLAEPPLPHSIGAEFVRADGKTEIEIIFPRSTPLPAQKILHCKTDRTLRPSQPDEFIAIKIWEGESTNPEANTWVCALKISGSQIRRPIPEGADIELSIAVNTSRLMEVEAFVPMLNQHFREGVYIPDENREDITEKLNMLRGNVDLYFDRLRRMQEILHDNDDPELKAELQALTERLENHDLSEFNRNDQVRDQAHEQTRDQVCDQTRNSANDAVRDPGEDKIIYEELRAIRVSILELEHKIEKESGWIVRLRRLEWEKKEARTAVDNWGEPLDIKEYELLCREMERNLTHQDERAITKLADDFRNLRLRILLKQDWFWQQMFNNLSRPSVYYSNREAADKLIKEGEKAIAHQEWKKLREIVEDLFDMLPKDILEQEKDRVMKAGIRRN